MRVGEDRAAYLTIKAALNGHAHHPSSHATGRLLRAVSINLMGMLADEVRAERFVAADSAAYANAVNHAKGSKVARSQRLRKRMKFHGIEGIPSPGVREATNVGTHLLAAMCDSTGAFEIMTSVDTSRGKYRTHLVLYPTEATLQWIATRSDRLRLTMPLHPPTLIPPLDWGPGVSGGYHFCPQGHVATGPPCVTIANLTAGDVLNAARLQCTKCVAANAVED